MNHVQFNVASLTLHAMNGMNFDYNESIAMSIRYQIVEFVERNVSFKRVLLE